MWDGREGEFEGEDGRGRTVAAECIDGDDLSTGEAGVFGVGVHVGRLCDQRHGECG